MPVVDVNSLIFKPFTLTDSDFSAGRDDDTALSAGQVGEIGTAEVGEDGQLSNYDAVQLGQPPSKPGGDVSGNEVFVKLQSGGADIADTAEWGFSVRRKGELSAGADGEITGFRTHRGQDNSDPRQRNSMMPQSPVAKDGRVLQLLGKDETAAVTIDLSESTFQIPALGGQ